MPGGYDGDIKLKVDLTPGDIKRTSRVLQSNVKNVFDATVGKALNHEFQKLQANIAKTSGRANQLSKQLDDLWESKKVPTKEYAEIQEQIDEAKVKLEELNKQMQMAKDLGIDTQKSSAFKSLVEQADELQNTIKYANGELEDLRDNNQAWQLDTSAQTRYQGLLNQLNDVNNALVLQLRLLQESAQQSGYVDQATSRFSGLRNVIQSVVSALRETWEFGPNLSTIFGQSIRIAKQNVDSLKQSILNIGPNIKNVLGSIQNTFARIGSSAQSAGSMILSGLQHPILSLDHILGFLVSSAGQAVRAIGSLTATGAINALSALGTSAKQTAIILGGALVNALRNVAINAANTAKQLLKIVTTKLTGGIKNLVSHFNLLGSSAKRSVPSVKKIATTLLKYGLGVRSFYFLFRKIRSAISEGFSNLAEYSEPFKAVMDDFKSSLSTLKNSFAASFAPIATAVIPALTTLINTVSSAIEAVGKLIATLMGKKTYTKAVKGFNSVGSSAGSANEQAKELQKTIAGFDDVEILGNNNPASNGAGSGGIGTDASGMFEEVQLDNEFNKLAEMIKEAWKKADFTEIGTLIGEKLRDALDNIPWDKIKQTTNKIAKSIATLLNGFLETPGLFDIIGNTLGEALNTALGGLNTFATNFHWGSLGRAISSSINAFFRTADFKLAADTFSNWAKGILETVYTTLENINWRQIGRKIKEFLVNVDWSGIAEGIAEAFGAALGGVTALIVEVFKDIPGKIKEYFVERIKKAGWDKDKGLIENGKAILEGILNGILDALKGIGKWVKEHVLDPFIKGFKKAFGIASPAKAMEETGENILKGVLEGMLNIIKNIKKWVSDNILTPIKNAFKGFKATIEVGLEKAKNWSSDVWEGIKSGAQTIKKTIKHGMEALPNWKDKVLNFFKDPSVITKTIKNGMESLPTWKDKIFNFFTGKDNTIEKTLSLDVIAKNNLSKTALNKLGIFTANTLETLLQVKVEAAVENMKDNRKNKDLTTTAALNEHIDLRKNKSVDTTAKYNNVDKTALTGNNKPWIYTDSYFNTAKNNLGFKPWYYADSYYNTAKNNLGGKPWYYADSYYNTANNYLGYKPWYYTDTYYNTAKNNLGFKPWYYADSYYNTAKNYLSGKPWFYADAYYNSATEWLSYTPWLYVDAYMNRAYDVIPAAQKVINVVANVANSIWSRFTARGGIFSPYNGWSDIPQYAGGTSDAGNGRAHGSMFIAGEAGPELVGHINGRTEILNKSQIASAIYTAVKTAMLVGMNQLSSIIPVPLPINIDVESLGIPDIVKGCIVPYETRLAVIEDIVNNQNPDPVTSEELRGLVSDIITAVNKVQFYIGDEQIARHSQLGNQKLDRRYNPVIQGA